MAVGASPRRHAGPGPSLRRALAAGDAVLGAAAPMLRHLLFHEDDTLFSDAVIATMRGLLSDLAAQLLDTSEGESETVARLVPVLAEQTPLLCHLHAITVEALVTDRLARQSGLDPLASPLLKTLIAAEDAETARDAMALLAAQARFVQRMRRMELPLSELPADLFDAALLSCRALAAFQGSDGQAADTAARAGYDEGRGRIGLAARLVSRLGAGSVAALALDHAGLALFSTGLGFAADQPRDRILLSCGVRQRMRLGLTLRAAGLGMPAAIAQFALLHPAAPPPHDLDELRPAEALRLLEEGGPALAG